MENIKRENDPGMKEDIFLNLSIFTGERSQVHRQGRMLLYRMIREYYGVDLEAEQDPVAVLKEGKPYLKNHRDLHFNISHSADYVVCAVGRIPVGVDIQARKTVNYLKMGKKILSEEEWKLLTGKEDPKETFYHFWTKKESYVKYTGQGIRMDLTKLDYKGVKFYEFSPQKEYSGMLCVPREWTGSLQMG